MTSDIRPVPEVEAAVRQNADDSNTTKAASSVYDRSEEERGESKAFNENAGKVWEFERKSIERRKERIDNLLVFAALFSGILTAFVVDSYQSLQPQSTDETNQILKQISAQLSSFAVYSVHANLSALAFHNVTTPISTSVETATGSAVLINALWFSALVFSLTAASMGIVVRQWLNHHDNVPVAVDARTSIRIWHAIHVAFDDWHVGAILSTLPVRLQLALVLFLIGLVVMLTTLNRLVADIVLVQSALIGMFLLLSTIAPVVYSDCPYKSPQALWLLQLTRLLYSVWQRLLLSLSSGRFPGLRVQYDSPWIRNWGDYEQRTLVSGRQDLFSVAAADAAIMDDSFLEEFVRPTLIDNSYSLSALGVFISILKQRADKITKSAGCTWHPRNERDARSVVVLGHIAIDLLLKSRHESSIKDHLLLPICRNLDALLKAIPMTYIHIRRRLFVLTLMDEGEISERVQDEVARVFFHDIKRLSLQGMIAVDFAQTMAQRAIDLFIKIRRSEVAGISPDKAEHLVRISAYPQQVFQIIPEEQPQEYCRFFNIVVNETFSPRVLQSIAKLVFLRTELSFKFSGSVNRSDVSSLIDKINACVTQLEQTILEPHARDSNAVFVCSALSVLLGAGPTTHFDLYNRMFRTYLTTAGTFSYTVRDMLIHLLGDVVHFYIRKGDGEPMAALAEISTAMIVEDCRADRQHDKTRLASLRENISALLLAIPSTQADSYRQLLSALQRHEICDKARAIIVHLVQIYSCKFRVSSSDIQLLATRCFSLLSNNGHTLANLCDAILNLYKHLSDHEMHSVCTALRGALSSSMAHILGSGAWEDLDLLLNSCTTFVETQGTTSVIDASMFDRWERLISMRLSLPGTNMLCTELGNVDHMSKLRRAFGRQYPQLASDNHDLSPNADLRHSIVEIGDLPTH